MRSSLILKHRHRAVLAVLIFGLAAAAQAAEVKKNPNPFQGFSSDSGKPVDITSEALEVHQEDQMAIFSGNVVAKQGESTLCAPKLIVYYDNADTQGQGQGQAQKAPVVAMPATDPSGQASAIKKLEASGGVVVTAKDQIATGQTGLFDMVANLATLNDNVVLTQGNSVIKGKKLVVDMKTGVARVEGSGGVSSIFQKTAPATAPTTLACNTLPKGSTP